MASSVSRVASTARSGCRSCRVPRIATTCSGVLPAPYTTSASPVRAARSTSTRAKPRSSVRGSTGSCCTPGIYRPRAQTVTGGWPRGHRRLRSGPDSVGCGRADGGAGTYLGRPDHDARCARRHSGCCSPSAPPCRPRRRRRPGGRGATRRPDPDVVAHRGSSGAAPENTIAAIKLALEHRSDTVENDIQRTSDGELVIMHDTTLTRTTDVEEVFPDRAPWNVARLHPRRDQAARRGLVVRAGVRGAAGADARAVGEGGRASRRACCSSRSRPSSTPASSRTSTRSCARCPTSTGRCAPARSPCSRSTTSGCARTPTSLPTYPSGCSTATSPPTPTSPPPPPGRTRSTRRSG